MYCDPNMAKKCELMVPDGERPRGQRGRIPGDPGGARQICEGHAAS